MNVIAAKKVRGQVAYANVESQIMASGDDKLADELDIPLSHNAKIHRTSHFEPTRSLLQPHRHSLPGRNTCRVPNFCEAHSAGSKQQAKATAANMAATTNGANGDIATEHDLLPKMIPFLDRHMVFPLLNDLEDSQDIQKLKFELLKPTNMTDFVAGLEQELKGLSEPPAEYQKKREEVISTGKKLEEETDKLRSVFEDADVVSNLRSDKVANLNYLKENHGVTPEMVNALYEYGEYQYQCGRYQDSADLLYQFRILVGRYGVRQKGWSGED